MMDVSIASLFAIPVAFHLVFLFFCWLYFTVRQVARTARETVTRIYRCAICGHVYVDTRDLPLARCTRCGCLNEAIKR